MFNFSVPFRWNYFGINFIKKEKYLVEYDGIVRQAILTREKMTKGKRLETVDACSLSSPPTNMAKLENIVPSHISLVAKIAGSKENDLLTVG